jgi:carbohydrate-binding DOMON domain-containing protein
MSTLRPLSVAVWALVASAAFGQELKFKDPTGDDKGPGKYTYPTDTVYKAGSFDLTGLTVRKSGSKVDFEVSVNSSLEDSWKMGQGFSVQMAIIFIDTDGKEGSGHVDGLPGLNVKFAPADAWDRAVILSPQLPARVKAEVSSKAAALAGSIVVPIRTKGTGRKISGSVDLKDLAGDGEADITKWGYQVVSQSNEGFPEKEEILTRRVNEYEGQHRFGGGHDGMCDPHLMDVLAGDAKGDKAEADAQYAMLKYECAKDGAALSMATLTMVRAK